MSLVRQTEDTDQHGESHHGLGIFGTPSTLNDRFDRFKQPFDGFMTPYLPPEKR